MFEDIKETVEALVQRIKQDRLRQEKAAIGNGATASAGQVWV